MTLAAPLIPQTAKAERGLVAARRAIETAFDPVDGIEEAELKVREFARGQYENFSVVSRLVPRSLRQDFYNLYAFCRAADDLGDETGDRELASRHLASLRAALVECFAGQPTGAILTALRTTIERHEIPITPFSDLISAFEQDQHVTRYETFDQLLDYCRRSANPVGRLVLYVCGYRDDVRQRLADCTCTALQLANFLQDVRRDMDSLDRIYLPSEWMKKFGVTVSQLASGVAGDGFKALIEHGSEQAELLFSQGDALLPMLSRPVAAHVSLFASGGRAILDAIRAQDFDTLSRRPTVSRLKKAQLVARVLGASALTAVIGIRRPA